MGVKSIKVGDKSIDVEDLPMSVFANIEKETGIEWFDVWARPLANASAAILLVQAACEFMGVECPVLTPKTLIECVITDEQAESRPEMYEDGLPVQMPDGSPLSESDPQTG